MFSLASLLGVGAGLGTAFSWSVSTYLNVIVARVLGVHCFMMFRQPLAALILFVLCILFGQFSSQTWYIWGMAFVSGLLGIGVADWCAYSCMERIGLRAGVVFTSLASCMTAIMAVIFLDEDLGSQGMLGIMIATLGVISVVRAEKSRASGDAKTHAKDHAKNLGQDKPDAASMKNYAVGVVLGLMAAFFMAVSFIFSKEALNASMSPLMLTFVRNVAASVLLWVVALRLNRGRPSLEALKAHPELWRYLVLTCVVGAVFGIWLSSVALEYAGAAVGATLISLQPITTLLVTGVMERRTPPLGAMLGAVVACGGAAMLILR